MFCSFCSDLDLDQANTEEGAVHHASFTNLIQSAKGGCKLCMLIWEEEREEEDSELDVKNEPQIRYSYNSAGPALMWFQKARNGESDGWIAFFDICTALDDPLSDLVITRPILSDHTSEQFFDLINKWMYECSTHKECSTTTDNQLPTRLIDIGADGEQPRIFETHGKYGDWATLSHCWGSGESLQTTWGSLGAWKSILPWEDIPILFQDAMKITRQLGLRYLWIDSLCIIQDSKEDWIKEAAQMDLIYKNSKATIVAEGCPNSQASLYDVLSDGRDLNFQSLTLLQVKCHSLKEKLAGQLYCGHNFVNKAFCEGPLSDRAWTLQETSLSPRVLRFSKGQIWWQCRENQWNERIPYGNDHFSSNAWDRGLTSRIGMERLEEAESLQFSKWTANPLWQWQNVLNDFTRRHIFCDNDRLPAISGMAKQIKRHMNQEYKAGLWLDDIHVGLLWSCMRPGAKRPSHYIAPSWSWASIKFEEMAYSCHTPNNLKSILHSDLHNYGLATKTAQIVDVSVTNVNDDPFGRVLSGKLVISGPCHALCICKVPRSFLDCYDSDHSEEANPENTFEILLRPTVSATDKVSLQVRQNLNVEAISTLSCLCTDGIEHEESIYLHVGSYSSKPESECFPVVALALILKKQAGKNSMYERVGVAIFQELIKTVEIWPTETFTIL